MTRGMKIMLNNNGKEKVIPTISAATSDIRTTKVHLAEDISFRSALLAATTAAVRKKTAMIMPSKLFMKSIRIAKLVARAKLSTKTR
jgi:hypothetical protein